ncbi:MAG: glycerophosphodiester phosphodiesterase family protein [Faecousia sp.]
MKIVIAIVILVCVLYVLAVGGRTGNPKLSELRKWSYAHRGLHGEGIPENSMAAFRKALEGGYGIELDLHLLADGNLAVMHDSSLKRTAGADVRIEDLTTGQLQNYHLEGTEESIPQFQEVLELSAGKAPMIIELKAEGGNHDALCETVCKMLESYHGLFCIESFDPRCLIWLRKNRPELVRGQLAANFFAEKNAIPGILKFVMTYQLSHFLTRPDFVAYKFEDRKTIGNWICRKIWGVQGVSWTIRTKKDLDSAVSEGWIPIFEGFQP